MINFNYLNKKQCSIEGPELQAIRENFSVPNNAAKFQRGFRSKFIKDRIYAITPTGKCNIGLINEIINYCNSKNIETNIDDKVRSILNPKLPTPLYDFKLKFELRPYQKDIVNICISNGRGTVVLATAGGKTLTMASLLEYYFQNVNKFFKCLIIVPDLGLVNQTHNDFIEYNVSFTHSIWSGNNKLNTNTNVVVANIGILQSANSDIKWLSNIDILITDEVHLLRKTNKINKIISLINTPIKFGFTGTLPEDPIDKWNIFGTIGPQLYEKKAYELRDNKYVTSAKVHILKIKYKDNYNKIYNKNSSVSLFLQEKEFIKNNKYRNNIISTLSDNLKNNVLILIDYIEHGEILLETISTKSPNKKVYFIRGDVKVDERRKIQSLMEINNDIIVIAISKIFSTGINIKNLHYIIFANGGKAKIRIIQSIGRGLRLHKDKKQLIIFDIADDLTYSQKHVEARKKLYQSENIIYEQKEYFEK